MLVTAMLIAGYVLAVPPLFRLRHFWRRRNWLVYALELGGALLITLGMVANENVGGMIINGLWAAVFGIGFPLTAGRWRVRG